MGKKEEAKLRCYSDDTSTVVWIERFRRGKGKWLIESLFKIEYYTSCSEMRHCNSTYKGACK